MMLKDLLIKVRKKHNLSQNEMAQKLHISPTIYLFLEYGDVLWDTKPLIKTVKKIDIELSKAKTEMKKWKIIE